MTVIKKNAWVSKQDFNRGERCWRRAQRGENTVAGRWSKLTVHGAWNIGRKYKYWIGDEGLYECIPEGNWLSSEKFWWHFLFLLPPYKAVSSSAALFTAVTKETLFRCCSISATCCQRVNLHSHSASLLFLFHACYIADVVRPFCFCFKLWNYTIWIKLKTTANATCTVGEKKKFDRLIFLRLPTDKEIISL